MRPHTPATCDHCGHNWSNHEPEDWEQASADLWIEYPCPDPGCDCSDVRPTVEAVLTAQAEARRSPPASPGTRATGA